ncbi:MAG TPA: hypothetical protein V6D16_05295 [Candidatus Obscuribacterales bacterium]
MCCTHSQLDNTAIAQQLDANLEGAVDGLIWKLFTLMGLPPSKLEDMGWSNVA